MAKKIIAVLAMMGLIYVSSAQEMKNILTPRQQSLSAIAALEAEGDLERLQVAIGDGYDNGLTTSQIKEALSQLYAYTGFPRSLNSLGILRQVIAKRQDSGMPVPEGKEASPLPRDYDALSQGTAVQKKVSGREFRYDFAPAADYYLKAHLFGDIFARDNLTHAERELVTVSAISSLRGCEAQLRSHIRGAKNMGLSDDEIHSIPVNLEEKVGPEQALRCLRAVADVYGEALDEVSAAARFKVGLWDSPYPVGSPNDVAGQYFIGRSYLAPLDAGNGGPVNVTFEPACRNFWHIHHGEVQVLVCVAGRGWVQFEGQEPVEMTPGSVVAVPSGVKHWHGAARDSWFQHLAYHTRSEENHNTEWCEPLGDDEYNELP